MTQRIGTVQQTQRQQTKFRVLIKTALIALCASALLALSARLSVPVPFSPVPISMQTFAVLLMGGFLGSRVAAYSTLTYLADATLGLPVLAGGLSNPLWFCGPKAGYLIGFVVAAFVIGKLVERRPHMGLFGWLLTLTVGSATILLLGWSWLSWFLGPQTAFAMGVMPFLIGDVYKIVSAACLMRGYALYTHRK